MRESLIGRRPLAAATLLLVTVGCSQPAHHAPSPATEVTGENFRAVVLDSSQPVMVDFWAEWCGPCLQLAPTIDQLTVKMKGSAVIGKLDVDAHPEVAAEYGVNAIPTVIIFHQGREVDRVVGVATQEELESKLEPWIGQSRG